MKNKGIANLHFLDMHKLCDPCQIKYDYIAKLETHCVVAPIIIMNQLLGKGVDALANIYSTNSGAAMWKTLPHYNSINTSDVNELKYHFDLDMHVFG